MRPTVTYTPYATSSKKQTGDDITFAQFEEGNLLTETRNNEDGDPTTPHKLATSTKASVSHLPVLYFPYNTRKI